jgi:uncharacterized RDD family membrane protein YckC
VGRPRGSPPGVGNRHRRTADRSSSSCAASGDATARSAIGIGSHIRGCNRPQRTAGCGGRASIAQDIVYAGFLRRWAALFIDSIILSVVFYALMMLFGMAAVFGSASLGAGNGAAALNGMLVMMNLLYFLLAGAYYSLLESSSNQATVGKMALGIKVTDRDGQRLSFAHALGRWAAASISYLTFYIGFFLAGWTERKQALHDFVAGTLVVDRWAFTDQPEKQQRQLHGCAVAFLVVIALLIVISVIGIVAAIAIPAYEGYVQRM